MNNDFKDHIVLEYKISKEESVYVDLFRDEILSLLEGKSPYDNDFLDYLNDERFKSRENTINFLCKYKDKLISIRRVIEYFGETSPIITDPRAEVIKYTRTYDAATILLELGIVVEMIEESKSGSNVFSKYHKKDNIVSRINCESVSKRPATSANTAFTHRADARGRRRRFEEVVAATTPYGSS